MEKISIEIWSDIMCPFCYLGKRRFEQALAAFDGEVEVVWRSFLLQPELRTDPSINIHQYLSEIKGFPPAQARQMNERLTAAGREAGLDYRFDDIVVANTRRAHQLLHAAAEQGLQNALGERLFRAYFSEGRNVDDPATLLELALDAGLDTAGLEARLESGAYSPGVDSDVQEAQRLGIRGVPFFVFNRKYAVSGAQDTAVFLEALERVAVG